MINIIHGNMSCTNNAAYCLSRYLFERYNSDSITYGVHLILHERSCTPEVRKKIHNALRAFKYEYIQSIEVGKEKGKHLHIGLLFEDKYPDRIIEKLKKVLVGEDVVFASPLPTKQQSLKYIKIHNTLKNYHENFVEMDCIHSYRQGWEWLVYTVKPEEWAKGQKKGVATASTGIRDMANIPFSTKMRLH